MPHGKPGEILCAMCSKRILNSDETSRVEATNHLVHAECERQAEVKAAADLVRLLIMKAVRCAPCIAKKSQILESQLDPLLELIGPQVTMLGARCDDCRRIRTVYTIR